MSSSFLDKLVGLHYRYPDHYVVGREKIREYAVAVKNDDAAFFDDAAAADLGHDALLAPLTFISVFGYQAQLGHVCRRQHRHRGRQDRPGRSGAQVPEADQGRRHASTAMCTWTRSGSPYGADIIVTKNIVTNDNGEVVQETYTTLAGRTGEDGEEGGFQRWHCVSSIR